VGSPGLDPAALNSTHFRGPRKRPLDEAADPRAMALSTIGLRAVARAATFAARLLRTAVRTVRPATRT
jgi:hypothetical protein